MSMAVSHFSFPRRRWLSACLAAALTVSAPLANADETLLVVPSTLSLLGTTAPWNPAAAERAVSPRSLPRPYVEPNATSAGSPAATRVVTNCNDGGAGSLRSTVAEAISGDTVDLSALTCSTITLTTGAVAINVDTLTITGPGADQLAIDGNNVDRVFTHNVQGTLTIRDLAMVNGRALVPSVPYLVRGGCIEAAGSLFLERTSLSSCSVRSGTDSVQGGCARANRIDMRHSTAHDCRAISDGTGWADGGALFAGAVTLVHSKITGNLASAVNQVAYGGGVVSAGFNPLLGTLDETIIVDSTVSGNVALGREYIPYGTSEPIDMSYGGGVHSGGRLTITSSTLADNEAGSGGGAYLTLNASTCEAGVSATVVNSTITGNTASNGGGGMVMRYCVLQLSSSTVAFNHATHGAGGIVPRVFPTYGENAYNPIFTNSIIASNTSTLGSADVDVGDYAISIGPIALTGSNNLILASSITPPTGTLVVDPMLASLSDNGGPTHTHALLPGSPAIDAGTNAPATPFDQRGDGFPRVVGTLADLGAFERQGPSDGIFMNGFD